MANRIKLPGILGAAAEKLGVSVLAKKAGTNPRTLYNWATNRSPTPAIAAMRIAELCYQLKLKPMLFLQPDGGERDCIASTPQGWIYNPLEGYSPNRYHSVVEDPTPAPSSVMEEAPKFGWPWMGSGRSCLIPVWVDLETAFGLHTLLDRAKEVGTMGETDGVDDLMSYVADRLEEGERRPGSWEGQVVASLFGL